MDTQTHTPNELTTPVPTCTTATPPPIPSEDKQPPLPTIPSLKMLQCLDSHAGATHTAKRTTLDQDTASKASNRKNGTKKKEMFYHNVQGENNEKIKRISDAGPLSLPEGH